MCIINQTYKFLFVHVPKSAGTSVSNYYSQFSTVRDIEIGGSALGEALQPFYIKRYGVSKHSTFSEISKAFGEVELKKYFTFGFVRNPYDRAVSSFTFLRKWDGWKEHAAFQNFEDVNDFISSDVFKGDGVDRQFKPQSFWLGDNQKQDSPKIAVDFVGKLENIEADISKINTLIGLDEKTAGIEGISKKNSSREYSKNVNLELNKESIEIINKRYVSDFDLFEYEMVK